MRLRGAGEVVDVEPDPNLRRMSPTLGMAIARRLAFLSGQTRELLQVAALLGAEFSVADVAAVLDRPVTDLLGPVREATAAGLLTAQADRVTTALRLYTMGTAELNGEADRLGSIAPGKLADLVGYRLDPLAADPDDLAELTPTFTITGGRAVHDPSGMLAAPGGNAEHRMRPGG